MSIATGQNAEASDISAIVPPGVVLPYAGSSAPTGYLLCDGAEYSRTTYAALYSAIGTDFGAGDGSSTFNVPDLRGVAVIGAGTRSGTATRSFDTTNVDVSADTITATKVHGLGNGKQIAFTASSSLPRAIDTSQSSGTINIDGSGNIQKGSLDLPAVNDVIRVVSGSSISLSTSTNYFVISVNSGSGTFQVSTTQGGSVAGSGNSGTLAWSPSNTIDNINSNTYYAFPTSNTAFQIATSIANGIAGSFLDITMAGSGTRSFTYSKALTARALADEVGEENHNQTISEIASHNHALNIASDSTRNLRGTDVYHDDSISTEPNAMQNAGGSVAMNNMQPSLALNWIIRYIAYS